MPEIADPHPGADVAVEGPVGPTGMAHRRATTLVKDPYYKDGRMMPKAVWPAAPACGATDRVKSFSWGFAHAQGVELCIDAACYPEAE